MEFQPEMAEITEHRDRKELFNIEKVKKEDEEKNLSSHLSTCVDNITRKLIVENELKNEEFRVRNNSFHSEFILFRRTLQLKKILRKTRIDSLLKKCKSKVFRTIQEAINLLTGLSNSKDNRLPQSFITNINIEYNKKFLHRSIEDIYKDCKVFKSAGDLIGENPNMSEEDKTYLSIILSMTHKEAFESYIKSNRYQIDYNYIKQREGEKYAILFDYVAKIYVRYFLNGRGNKKRNLRMTRVSHLNYTTLEGSSKSNSTGSNDKTQSTQTLPLYTKLKFKNSKHKKKIVFKTY